MMYNQFETGSALGLKRNFAKFMYYAANIFRELTVSLSDSTSGKQKMISKCTNLVSKQLVKDIEVNYVPFTASALATTAASADTIKLMSAGNVPNRFSK